MDKELKRDIMATVRAAMQQVAEENEEVYLSKEQLLEQFGFLSESWLRRYGHLLPRTECQVEDNGVIHRTGWGYPRNKIQRMIMNNQLKFLKA